MNHLFVFSCIYLIVASISLVMGFYVLNLHRKGMVNRLFAVVSVCLTLWALGFSILIIAPSAADCVFWIRFASCGYGVIYSVLLHFTLALTGQEKVLSRKWIYPLLYLPAAFCLYAFVLSPGLAEVFYQFSYTGRGWVRSAPSTVFDYVFYIYYFTAVGLSLGLIGFWKRRSDSLAVKKQANILLAAFFVAFGLGTVTDIFNGRFFELPMPQMAPVLFLIPLGVIFYCIQKYHFMRAPSFRETEVIVTDTHVEHVFRVALFGLLLGSAVLMATGFFWWRTAALWRVLLAGFLMVFLFAALQYTRRRQKSLNFLELLLITFTLVITPLLSINMIGYGAINIWVFPIIMIICSQVFNLHNMLFASSVSLILSQIYVWAVMPMAFITVDYRSYASRIVILVFIIAAAYYVHRLYTMRLRENAEQTRTQVFLNRIASTITAADKDSAGEKIEALLLELARFFEADTICLRVLGKELDKIAAYKCFRMDGSEEPPGYADTIMARWEDHCRSSIESAGPDESWAPAEPAESSAPAEPAGSPKPSAPAETSATWAFIPIRSQKRPVGFIYMESSAPIPVWAQEHRMTFSIVSRMISDALEKLISEVQIKFLAYYDKLTNLPNRQLFHDRVNQAIHLARRQGRMVAVMFLDLDSFKSVNDTLGHEGGDILIRSVAKNLSEVVRKSDSVARFGGDEFLIMMNNIADVEDITVIADKIMDVFKKPVVIRNQEVFVTASAGIALYPADGEDTHALVKHADIAMYAAKENGKNRYTLCSPNMKELVQYKMSLSNSLYRALDRNELEVYYQPQVSLENGEIIGLEALLRWFHPELGSVPPSDFIPLAEQTGLINPIGHWVLKTACRQHVEWKKRGLSNVRLSVNLSVAQLRNPNLVGQIGEIIAETGVDSADLELEITESVMTKEADYIIGVLNDLKAMGLSISIDDFGTEYSSLNRLKMLPIDRLKVDIQFVHGIEKSQKDRAITMVIINLAKSLDLKLIAEGVESKAQLDFLKQQMCDEVQGFYYFKPMPASEAEKVIL